MLAESLKFMSPVNNVWKLCTLYTNFKFSGFDTIVVHYLYISMGNTFPNCVINWENIQNIQIYIQYILYIFKIYFRIC